VALHGVLRRKMGSGRDRYCAGCYAISSWIGIDSYKFRKASTSSARTVWCVGAYPPAIGGQMASTSPSTKVRVARSSGLM
jgi:hypothetical protein